MSFNTKIHQCMLLVIAGVFLFTADAQAGWFDSFKKSVVTNPGSSWTLQQQSHYAAGGFSTRFESNQRPFMTITAPRISVGCGGIDAFWGGFSFMNPEYFVQMFRNIMAAAPAFAFHMALTSLCPSCMEVLNTLQELANIANSLAMDECAAAQALGYAGGRAIASILGGKAEKGRSDGSGSEWLEEFKKFNGRAQTFLSELKEKLQDTFCGFLSGALLESCKKVYVESGTLWQRAIELDKMKHMSGNRTLDEEFVKVLRAIVGDIEITHGNEAKDEDGNKTSDQPTKPVPKPIWPCDGATPTELYNAMILSTDENVQDVYVLPDGNTTCHKEPIPESLRVTVKARKAIADIQSKLFKTGENLEAGTIEVINENSLPIYKMINLYALRTTTRGGVFMSPGEANLMIHLASLGHAAHMINTSMVRATSVLAHISSELEPIAFEAGADPLSLGNLRLTMIAVMGKMSDNFNAAVEVSMTHYRAYIESLANTFDVQIKYEEALVRAAIEKQ